MSFDSFKKSILKNSDSYNFYKNAYDKLKYDETFSEKLDNSFSDIKKEFSDIKKEYMSIENQINSLNSSYLDMNSQVNGFKKDLNLINEQLDIIYKNLEHNLNFHQKLKSDIFINKRFLKEMKYAHIFRDTITNSDWLFNKSFSPNNSAANYSFLYVLYRILDEVKPLKILELGLGQTTLLTSQYANFFENTNLQVIEDNEKWIEYFSNKLDLTPNVKINLVNKKEILINSFKCFKYENFSSLIKDDLFNLLIIDGPYGANQEYPRSNILDLIDNLADNFVIIIDDYDRQGEANTSKILLDKLSENGINFDTSVFSGIKNQLVIYSKDNHFIGWF